MNLDCKLKVITKKQVTDRNKPYKNGKTQKNDTCNDETIITLSIICLQGKSKCAELASPSCPALTNSVLPVLVVDTLTDDEPITRHDKVRQQILVIIDVRDL